MIFLGDVAHPFSKASMWRLKSLISDISSFKKPVIVNLEGPLVEELALLLHGRKLFNHYSILDSLIKNNTVAVCLANNHVLDVSQTSLANTGQWLKEAGIEYFGAGKDVEDASRPAILNVESRKWMLLGFGWETIQCRAAGPNKSGVNPLKAQHVLESTAYLRKKNPAGVLVLMLHWNYEMELYPQPAHRQFAMAAIDEGADAVIGHHPHRVGGVEMYKGRPIAYSLGNWWMPQGVYFGGRLRFGDESLLELALEWQPDSEIVCHWFEYERVGHRLIHIGSEPFRESERIRKLTPFAGMDHETYQRWFRAHRIKKRLLPIYYDYRHNRLNSLKDWFVLKRQVGLQFLEATGLRRTVDM